jgi:steroid 5-alpha reductase family enzyme
LPYDFLLIDFGEILTWWSIYFTTFPGLVEAGIADGEGSEYLYPLLGLFSPVFITFLLLKVSGIPLLEKKHYKEFGNIPEYKDYVRRTSLLLPWPSSSSKKHSQKSK